jgi:hypothetical protein
MRDSAIDACAAAKAKSPALAAPKPSVSGYSVSTPPEKSQAFGQREAVELSLAFAKQVS